MEILFLTFVMPMKLKFIDFLRGIAVFLVIIIHTANYGKFGEIAYSSGFRQLTNLGQYGVQLFFIISAFTLILSYKARDKKEIKHVRNFFIRRYFRIAPIYYLGIVYFLWQNRLGPRWWTGFEKPIEFGNILSNIFFANWIDPYWLNSLVPGGWSISVEFSFYLIVPLLMLFIKNFKGALTFTIITYLIGGMVTHYYIENPSISNPILWSAYLDHYFPKQLFVFGFGFKLYYAIIKKDWAIGNWNKYLLPLAVFSSIFWSLGNELIIVALIFSVAMLWTSKLYLSNVISTFFIYLGKISYSSYIIHFITLHWLSYYNFMDYLDGIGSSSMYVEYLIRLVVVSGITIFLAKYSFEYIEKPFGNLAKKLIAYLNTSVRLVNFPHFLVYNRHPNT